MVTDPTTCRTSWGQLPWHPSKLPLLSDHNINNDCRPGCMALESGGLKTQATSLAAKTGNGLSALPPHRLPDHDVVRTGRAHEQET